MRNSIVRPFIANNSSSGTPLQLPHGSRNRRRNPRATAGWVMCQAKRSARSTTDCPPQRSSTVEMNHIAARGKTKVSLKGVGHPQRNFSRPPGSKPTDTTNLEWTARQCGRRSPRARCIRHLQKKSPRSLAQKSYALARAKSTVCRSRSSQLGRPLYRTSSWPQSRRRTRKRCRDPYKMKNRTPLG